MKKPTLEERYQNYCDWCISEGHGQPAKFELWLKVVDGIGYSLKGQLERDGAA